MLRGFLLAVVALVVVLVMFVFYLVVKMVFPKQKPGKPAPPDDLSDVMVIERVSREYCAETELQILKRAQTDLLVAGDAVLGLRSHLVFSTLSAPVSKELKGRVSDGDDDVRLTPARVRAAVAVGEISMALENLMLKFSSKKADPLFVILDEARSEIIIGKNKIHVGHVIKSFAGKIELGDGDWENAERHAFFRYKNDYSKYVAVVDIWEAVVVLLREGKTRIPGLRVNKEVLIFPTIIVNE